MQLLDDISWKYFKKPWKRIRLFIWKQDVQYEVIEINIDMKVAKYYGAKGVDGWSAQTWNDEINKHEVLVMTPQILLDVLRHGFLQLKMVKLIIFDECHHTQGNHPYAKIMKEFYQTSQLRPKIFGMTASPVIKKGVSSSHDCMDQIAQLEGILDSQVYALEDRRELERFVPTPSHKTIYYSPSCFNYETVKVKLTKLCEKYEIFQESKDNTLLSKFKDYEEFIVNSRKEIQSIHRNIEYCLENLGLYCAYKAVQVFMERCKSEINFEIEVEELHGIKRTKNIFLQETLQTLKQFLPNGMENFYSMQGVREGLLTHKVYMFIRSLLLNRKLKEMHCIVFVERVIAAVVISSLINELDCLSNISSEYLASGNGLLETSRNKQQSTLDQFCLGKVNVLVTTNVTEEGIDVQGCSCIIRFDLPNTVRSYIQSRGRARKPESEYVVLIERNNETQLNLLFDIIRSEESMRDTSLNRNNICYTPKFGIADDEKMIPYNVSSTGATVNCDSSIDLIYKYCAKLPSDKYYSPRPEFIFRALEGKDNLHICILRLPPSAPFHEVVSHPSVKQKAKQFACLEACKRLHEVGALDEHLIPVIETGPEEEIVNLKIKCSRGAGTTKRKELHITSKPEALSGYWGENHNGVKLQVYKIVFTSQGDDKGAYSNFALLLEAVLDNDVANAEIDLHLTAGRVVRSRFIPCGTLYLDSVQIMDAKAYHEILFNGVFNKLVLRTRETNELVIAKRNILENKILEGIWVSSNMYFILPLELEKSYVSQSGVNIDWNCIRQCADVARSVRANTRRLHVGETNMKNIHLASGPLVSSDLLEKAIVTLHTGKIYCITDILHDKTAESPFPDATKYGSYSDYFEKKYGKKLNFLKQPLLQVKQTHRPHNLLTRYGEKFKGKELDLKLKPNYIELPAELCLNLGVPSSVIRSLYLIPSVMHRMSNLMLASQLREEIQKFSNCPFISATLIMQALTTMRCMESFSFERLELLGDSVLKYAVSCHLFLKYDKKHEGQLSAHRSLAVCNATLHDLALRRNLPGYIRDEPFSPSRWVAPGTHCKRIVSCFCDGKMIEESVKGIVDMEDKVVKVGKTCDKGHRWMCSKTIADSVEALIGSYLVGGGLSAALEFMSWLNIPVAYESGLVTMAFEHSSVHPSILSSINIHMLESQLGYVFHNKALLVEAITHASQEDSEGGCCYQRLEFLGDSVLDFLITRHLFREHPDLTPGVLTDLRSAAVNNESFAYVAVKYNLHQYLRHGSAVLLGQITRFVRAAQNCMGAKGCPTSPCGVKAPKVLGDIVESIAGAILVDSRFDVEHVWKIMKPLLSPIVTPETLHLHPIREVSELCHLEGYRIVWKKSAQEGELYLAILEVVLEDNALVGKGCNISKKSAKEEAAQQILMQLKKHGIHHPRCSNVASDTNIRGTKQSVEEISSLKDIATTCNKESDASESIELARKKSKIIINPAVEEAGWTREKITKKAVSQSKIADACKRKSESSQNHEIPEKKARTSMASVKSKTSQDPFHDKKEDIVCNDAVDFYARVCVKLCMQRGGPRNNLYDACKKLKWCGPEFHLLEGAGRPHATRFSFRVVVHIPEKGELSVDGEMKSDKKSAMDAAAMLMLSELKKQGFCSLKR
ncbi:endoribonuclease Dicer homolog 3a isoform X2 [Cryptomeria japonica]|uniref:endoribonuclease Dicer homolog 3a isoform X2 n=1 Tax=Cryptomeria japonica TaxID=3369 RepID=UPI0027DA5952|nr:endoribonuclease Dicer homolog 3a isoform X2 [Cryptomeria japonica]